MKRLFLFSLGIFFSMNVLAQTPSFTAVLSSDTTNLASTFELTFKIEGKKNESFIEPEFSDFDVVYQNQSTQMSITNGEMTQSVSYVFGLKAKEEGSFAIEKASVQIDGTIYYTDYIKVVVDENYVPKSKPRNNTNFWNPFEDFPSQTIPKPKEPTKKAKKKRKIYKI
ncbi:MAG: BatD family protein [Saprospiraceae bacterium]